MTVGLQVLNDNGSILITQDYANLGLFAKGIVNSGSNSAAQGIFGQVNFGSNARAIPLIFIQGTGFACITNVALNGFSYRMATGVTTFKWWAFCPPGAPPAHGAGLQVFDAGGNLMFDTDFQYVSTIQVVAGAGQDNTFLGTGVGAISTVGIARSSNIAYCASDPGYMVELLTGSGVSGGSVWRNLGAVGLRQNGASIQFAPFQILASVTPPANVNRSTRVSNGPAQVVIADISFMNQ